MNYKTATTLVTKRIKGTRKGLNMPRFMHSVSVGIMLRSHLFDQDVCIAGLLHDIIEDSSVTYTELEELGFSEKVLDLVRLVTHDEAIKYKDHRWFLMISLIIESENWDALAIKLCDTMDNFKDSRGLPLDRQPVMRFKLETLIALSKPVLKKSRLLMSAQRLLTKN